MRIAGRRYRDEWFPNYYPARQIGDRFVRLSRTGKTQILTACEDAELSEFFMNTELFGRLERTGHIITAENAHLALDGLKTWLKGTYDGPQLHIVVATKRCNLNCTYCHMNPEAIGSDKHVYDLQPQVATEIARFILESPNPTLVIEMQGGEPFLNFAGMVNFIEEITRQNLSIGKHLSFNVVSNLMVATDKQLEYCLEHNISVSYTINGPKDIHDQYRITRDGCGSFDAVIRRFEHIRSTFPGLLSPSPLCVISADNAKDMRGMLDFYHGIGFNEVAVINLKHLGNAARGGLQFNAQEFTRHYVEALDYLYNKNKDLSGRAYGERLVKVALLKILCASDTNYIDWRNPIGYVSGALVYDYDGEILPADEARSMREVFTLGNVMALSYDELIRKKETFKVLNLSIRDRDPECRECPYNPYCGVSPVLQFAKRGRMAPRAYESDDCIMVLAILDWVFKKLIDDPIPLIRMVPELSQRLNEHLGRQGASRNSEVRTEGRMSDNVPATVPL
jgi:uncharacterized protein